MATPGKYTDAFIIIKKLFLGGLQGLQSNQINTKDPVGISLSGSLGWAIKPLIRPYQKA